MKITFEFDERYVKDIDTKLHDLTFFLELCFGEIKIKIDEDEKNHDRKKAKKRLSND